MFTLSNIANALTKPVALSLIAMRQTASVLPVNSWNSIYLLLKLLGKFENLLPASRLFIRASFIYLKA